MSELDEDNFLLLHNDVKRGDIIGVEGHPGKSQKGELSIFPVKFVVLAPCLHMPPSLHFGLKDQVRREGGGGEQVSGWVVGGKMGHEGGRKGTRGEGGLIAPHARWPRWSTESNHIIEYDAQHGCAGVWSYLLALYFDHWIPINSPCRTLLLVLTTPHLCRTTCHRPPPTRPPHRRLVTASATLALCATTHA